MSREANPPSLYEWVGGEKAIQPWISEFYTRVLADDLLGPVFEHMKSDHPTFVAEFIGEVLGGPDTYSKERGGHPHMIRAHLNRHLDHAKRKRWSSCCLNRLTRAVSPMIRSFDRPSWPTSSGDRGWR